MAKFIVPKNVGRCFVGKGLTSLWTVMNNQSGKRSVYIPCKTRREADSICDKLNTGNHKGQISIPQHAYHVP